MRKWTVRIETRGTAGNSAQLDRFENPENHAAKTRQEAGWRERGRVTLTRLRDHPAASEYAATRPQAPLSTRACHARRWC